MSNGSFERHLEAHQIGAYVDGALAPDARVAVQAHLATCAECRAELVEVAAIVRTAPAGRRARSHIWIPVAAAAAAAFLVLAWPRSTNTPEVHREEAVTMTVAPRPVAPVGTVDSVRALVWRSVPGADRYSVRLFDAEGGVLWQHETEDTVATLTDSIALRPALAYFWKVEAQSGFDRRAASDLVEFSVRPRGR